MSKDLGKRQSGVKQRQKEQRSLGDSSDSFRVSFCVRRAQQASSWCDSAVSRACQEHGHHLRLPCKPWPVGHEDERVLLPVKHGAQFSHGKWVACRVGREQGNEEAHD